MDAGRRNRALDQLGADQLLKRARQRRGNDGRPLKDGYTCIVNLDTIQRVVMNRKELSITTRDMSEVDVRARTLSAPSSKQRVSCSVIMRAH